MYLQQARSQLEDRLVWIGKDAFDNVVRCAKPLAERERDFQRNFIGDARAPHRQLVEGFPVNLQQCGRFDACRGGGTRAAVKKRHFAEKIFRVKLAEMSFVPGVKSFLDAYSAR